MLNRKMLGIPVALILFLVASLMLAPMGGVSKALATSATLGNASTGDLLSGKTATVDAGQMTGTMPNNGALNLTPSGTGPVNIPAGYTSGGSVAQVNVPAGNVLSGTTIAGVAGTMVNRSGGSYTNLSWQNVSGSIRCNPPVGYWDGNTNVGIQDANLVSANILSGVSIFGVNGTVTLAGLGGKRVATGSISANGTNQTVSGLGFTPAYVFMADQNNTAKTYWLSWFNGVNSTYMNTGNILSVGSGYFTFNSYSSRTLNWIAIGS